MTINLWVDSKAGLQVFFSHHVSTVPEYPRLVQSQKMIEIQERNGKDNTRNL